MFTHLSVLARHLQLLQHQHLQHQHLQQLRHQLLQLQLQAPSLPARPRHQALLAPSLPAWPCHQALTRSPVCEPVCLRRRSLQRHQRRLPARSARPAASSRTRRRRIGRRWKTTRLCGILGLSVRQDGWMFACHVPVRHCIYT